MDPHRTKPLRLNTRHVGEAEYAQPLESSLLNLAFLQMGKERPRITKQVPPPPCVSDGILMPT